MARLASVAVAGYFPTPTHLCAAIAALVAPSEGGDAWLDPCCGKGEALALIARALYPAGDRHRHNVDVYGVEMERGRAKAATEALRAFSRSPYGQGEVIHGDALRVEVARQHFDGVSALYLNPPYDLDQRYRRLEERFLRKYIPALATDGVLLFVVPTTALAASADTLGAEFHDVVVHRFPDADFAEFRQVVVVARKRATALPIPAQGVVEAVLAAAAAPSELPVLGEPVVPRRLPELRNAGVGLDLRPVSVDSLDGVYVPWGVSTRSGAAREAANIHPKSATAGLDRRFPTAMPLKPGHLAAALAAGVFNGECVMPDTPDAAPPLLVKGVFRREWVTTEEKTDRDGAPTGCVQVEAPRLEVTALDLTTGLLHTLRPEAEPTGARNPAEMTTGDLLVTYARGLLSTMRAHCPPDYDPDNPALHFDLVETARPLYRAQVHTARAAVMQLGGTAATSRHGRYATLIGEVGSGKSSVLLVAAQTIGARRVLVVCPPHLLTGWANEVAAVWPGARVVVLDSVAAVDRLAASTDPQPVVALLTRETAKLGHGWRGVRRCPACGHTDPRAAETLATKRARCGATIRTPRSAIAALALDYARRLAGHAELQSPAGLGFRRRVATTAAAAIDGVLRDAVGRAPSDPEVARFLTVAGWSSNSPELRVAIAGAILGEYEHDAARFLSACDPQTPGWGDVAARVTAEHTAARLRRTVENVWFGGHNPSWECFSVYQHAVEDGSTVLSVDGRVVGSAKHVDEAVLAAAVDSTARACGEPLYQATASPRGESPFGGDAGTGPRRYPLATYISRRHPRLFDCLGLDEAHEYGGDGSAQERAAHRLTALRLPTVLLTGSLVNGYARHLFANLWGLDAEFRGQYPKTGVGKFSLDYGYRRRFLPEGGSESTDRGAVTDRVESGPRDLGDAPGVQPLAVLSYVVRHAVTLHKAELDTGIPELTTELVLLDPDEGILAAHKAMLAALVAQVKRDAFTDLAGALWGQLAEAPSHLDRATADTGNTDDGSWVVRYPPHRSDKVVHTVAGCDPATELPKERWTVAKCKAEVASGRPVIVLAWHTVLFPRVSRLLRAAGLRVSVLDASKISAAKRQTWIEAQIAKGVDVLLTNPVAIQTGLNCLTHFSTTIWLQNPGCNAIVFRQANGRIDRIGQKQPPRCYVLAYRGSTQEALHTLLMRKVAVSQSTDGLDARSALQATGVGEATAMSTLSVGKLLFDLIDRGLA